ncbi:sigma-70 family RNA polymerase sigma factor [Actinomadura sp. DC4]|uniref:sigma-70 family RNA polymerase sigma factor n=1 Tax=Actinomadura sp. DC4 TaxID=3055069 RepID=UPI0025B085EF|nr:sigma-70 family RNA polymerase sigma factor [Actinomadura sp. DC4]MDN3356803.1 sigma-70 family RNA polymerase sigma factor [Actinomadura sp. DC4]
MGSAYVEVDSLTGDDPAEAYGPEGVRLPFEASGPADRPGGPAVTPDGDGFARLTSPYRPELLAYCYRMLGSVHDAEDLVQETYLRAWRSYGAFEGRASLRTWLYRIAVNVCLTALEHRKRRPLPSGLGGPAEDPEGPTAPPPEVSWLQPFPDRLAGAGSDDPAGIVATRASLRLALVAALQYLPPRQRAVLILRDVLAMRAAEVAEMLGVSVPAVKSILQRARSRLGQVAPSEDGTAEASGAYRRELLDRYVTAFEHADVPALMELLTEEAVLEMPPTPSWFAGREIIGRFFGARVLTAPGFYRMVATSANGQPAAAMYRRGPDGNHHAHGVMVLSASDAGITRIVAFRDSGLFDFFGLPHTLRP